MQDGTDIVSIPYGQTAIGTRARNATKNKMTTGKDVLVWSSHGLMTMSDTEDADEL